MSRPGGRDRRVVPAVRQLPFSRLVKPYAPIEVLRADQVEAIIDAALTILETRGMRFLDAGSREILRAAGAVADEANRMMRFDRGLVLEKLALAPARKPQAETEMLLIGRVGDEDQAGHARFEHDGVAAPLAGDDLLVDAAGGNIVGLGELGVREALVVAEVEIGLGAVVGDEDFAVLVRAHRARVDVEVGVALHDDDAQTARFEELSPPEEGVRGVGRVGVGAQIAVERSERLVPAPGAPILPLPAQLKPAGLCHARPDTSHTARFLWEALLPVPTRPRRCVR